MIRNKGFFLWDVLNKRRLNVNLIDDDNLRVENDDDEYVFIVGGGNIGGMINVLVGGVFVWMFIDFGVSINVIDKGIWEELKF